LKEAQNKRIVVAPRRHLCLGRVPACFDPWWPGLKSTVA
jgi:hypothetical protein